MLNAPIFIVSWMRSGSTLLRFVVDTHPQIACPAEVELGTLCHTLVQALVHTVGMKAPGEQGRQLVIAEIRRIASSIMADYARDKRKPLWCEKSPTNALYLPLIEAVFPDARFICLYRDGVDVVHSSVELRRKEPLDVLDKFVAKAGNLLEGAIDSWLVATTQMMALEKRRPRSCYRVFYETLVSDPQPTLANMFAWLDVDADPTIIDRVFTTPHDPGDGDAKALFSTGIDTRSVGRGRAHGIQGITAERRARFDTRLAELGYANADTVGFIAKATQAVATVEQRSGLTAHRITAGAFAATQEENALLHYMKTTFPERLRERYGELRNAGVLKLVIEGLEPTTWLLDFTGPRPYIAPVDRPTASVVTMSAATLAAIVNGAINPGAAYLAGDIRIEGDRSLISALRFIF